MLDTLFKKRKLNVSKSVDEIEAAVYAYLKDYGFKKYGRTLHRFVSEDISQVINFQTGLPTQGLAGLMCVNIGIRVPECVDRIFQPNKPQKKYYHEYECNMRSRIGVFGSGQELWFDLRKNSKKTTQIIIKEISEFILPAFDILSSRKAILAHRREYPLLDTLNNHLILLEEAMIYGHLGDMQTAKASFEKYYQIAVDKYNNDVINGKKQYLKKGERVIYMNQDITAEKDGYVTLYGANRGHIDYLDKLAVKLNLR